MNTGDRRNEVSFVPVPIPGHINDNYLDTEGPPLRRIMWRGGWIAALNCRMNLSSRPNFTLQSTPL